MGKDPLVVDTGGSDLLLSLPQLLAIMVRSWQRSETPRKKGSPPVPDWRGGIDA